MTPALRESARATSSADPAHLPVDPQRRLGVGVDSHGTRTNARSWARGWGRVSAAVVS